MLDGLWRIDGHCASGRRPFDDQGDICGAEQLGVTDMGGSIYRNAVDAVTSDVDSHVRHEPYHPITAAVLIPNSTAPLARGAIG